MHKLNLGIRTYRQLMHVECMKTQINTLRGIATARFYASSSTEEVVDAPPSQLQSPRLMLPPLMDETTGGMVYSFVNPIDNDILKIKKCKLSPLPNAARCYWSYHGWLAFIDPEDCGLYLWDPFHSYSNSCHPSNDVIRLPSIETLPCVMRSFLNDGEIEAFVMRYWPHCDDYRAITPETLSEDFVHSLTFSSAPSSSTENNDCTVMAIFPRVYGASCGYLAFCKLGDTSWTALDGPLGNYTQITYSNKDHVFYAMGGGEIEAWDLHDHSSIKRIPICDNRNYCTPRFKGLEEILRKKLCKKEYLLESSGDLFLVIKHFDDGSIISNDMYNYNRHPYQTHRFDVYKLDSSVGKWKYVKCLGDRALILGLTEPILIRAHNFLGLRPNCIYFADDDRSHYACVQRGYNYGGQDLGIFNLEKNRVEAYCPFGHLKRIEPPPIWVTPNLNGRHAG